MFSDCLDAPDSKEIGIEVPHRALFVVRDARKEGKKNCISKYDPMSSKGFPEGTKIACIGEKDVIVEETEANETEERGKVVMCYSQASLLTYHLRWHQKKRN